MMRMDLRSVRLGMGAQVGALSGMRRPRRKRYLDEPFDPCLKIPLNQCLNVLSRGTSRQPDII